MKKWVLMICSFFAVILQGEIVEISSLEEVEKYVTTDSLVIFDIDNTLLEPVQLLGSDQWFRHTLNEYFKRGMEKQEALNKALSEFYSIMHKTNIKLVEESAPSILKRLQKKGCCVMGLTTRDMNLLFCTFEQLTSIGIDFLTTAPSRGCSAFVCDGLPVIYQGGVLFANGVHKGKVFEHLLKKLQYFPKKVILIDDRKIALTQIEEPCKKYHLSFCGLRYNFLDKKIDSFDPKISEIQQEHLNAIIADDEAKKILESRKLQEKKR